MSNETALRKALADCVEVLKEGNEKFPQSIHREIRDQAIEKAERALSTSDTNAPFEFTEAHIGQWFETRGGKRAKLVAIVPEAQEDYRAVFLHDGKTMGHHVGGQYLDHDDESNSDVLPPAPKTRTVYVNFYEVGKSCYYDSADKARNFAGVTPIATAVPVEIPA